jgi:hypothetical protein
MTKPRKANRPRKKKKRRPRSKGQQQRGRLQDLKQRLEKDLLQGREVVVEPSGVAKMSEVLEAFVAPYLPLADTEEATQKLFALAVVAWNASFLAEEEQREMVDGITSQVMSAATREDKQDFRELVSTLVERKRTHFSEYTRKIIHFELTDTGRDYHLSVVSTMEGAPPQG